MSKYISGRYESGDIKHTYLKIWKHMPERHGLTGKLRRKLWFAKINAVDIQLDKQIPENYVTPMERRARKATEQKARTTQNKPNE